MKKLILIISVLLLIIFAVTVSIYLNAVEPVKAAEIKAVKIAKEETVITKVNDFNLYYGEESFFVVQGEDKKGTKWIAWIPQGKGKVTVKKSSAGITRQQAINKLLEEKKPDEIISVKLGMENERPFWEIHYRTNENTLNYYFVDFKTGEWLKKIENL